MSCKRYGTFGGPVALIGFMHRDLVEQRRWVDEDEYRLAVALAGLWWMQALFYGIGAAVSAIIAIAAS